MELIEVDTIEASDEIKQIIADLQTRLLTTEDALSDMTRAAEIVEVTGQRELLSTWIEQSNNVLRDRIVREDTSVGADQYKMTIITNDTASSKGSPDAM